MKKKIKQIAAFFVALILGLLFQKGFIVAESVTDAWTGDWSIIGDISNGSYISPVRGIAVDSTGTVYSATPYSAWIKRTTSKGWEIVPNCPFVQTQDSPWALAVDKNDNLYVANNAAISNGVVYKYTKATEVWTNITYGYRFESAVGIAVDSNLNVFVTDAMANKVLKLANGSSTWTMIGDNSFTNDASLNKPTGIAVDSKDNLYVTYAGSYGPGVRYLKSGTSKWDVIPSKPTGHFLDGEPGNIAIDKKDNIYVLKGSSNELNVLYHGTTRWTYINKSVTDKFKNPMALATDSKGNIYVTDVDANNWGIIYRHQGFANKLVWNVQPIGGESYQPLKQQPELWLTDVDGNLMTDTSNYNVILTLTSEQGSTLGGTYYVALQNGKATFKDLSVLKAGTYTLTAKVTFPKTKIIWDMSDPYAGIPSITKGSVSNTFTIEPRSATISPVNASYDKHVHKQAPVSTTITWNDATSITAIKRGEVPMTASNYVVNGNTLTFSTEAFSDATGSQCVFNILFDKGKQSVFTVDLTESPLVSASISHSTLEFDKNQYKQADVSTSITWNDARKVTNVKLLGVPIGSTNFTVSGNTLTIKKEYLKEQTFTQGDFTIDFDYGKSAAFTINVIETSTMDAEIVGNSFVYDKNPSKQADINASITWNDASTITGVVFKGNSLLLDTDFTIVNNNTLRIKKEYLAGLHLPVGSSPTFEVSFDIGISKNLMLSVIDTYVHGSDASLSNLKFGASTIPGFTSSVYRYNVTVPYGTQIEDATVFVEAVQNDPKATFNIVPATSIPGQAVVKVTAEDTTTICEYTITISMEAPPNQAPAAKNVINVQCVTCSAISMISADTIAEDADGDTLSVVAITNQPDIKLAKAELQNGVIMITGLAVGTTSIEVIVSDGKASAAIIVPIEVVEVPVPKYSFVIQATTGGSIQMGISDNYGASTRISIKAVPKEGYYFSIWISDNGGRFDDSNSSTTTFTMPAGQVTITALFLKKSEGGGSTEPGGGPTEPVATKATVTVTTNTGSTSPSVTSVITTQAKSDAIGKVSAKVTESQVKTAVNKAVEEAKKQGDDTTAKVEIKITASTKTTAVEASLPKAALTMVTESKIISMAVVTTEAILAFDKTALATIAKEATNDVKITISKVDTTDLSNEAKEVVGDRPVFNFSVTSDNKTISQFRGTVTVSVPYTPKALEDTNAIIIYYINAKGNAEIVKECAYNKETGMVTFKTNHFSTFAVGYHKVSFKDVSKTAGYADAVSYLAAREITKGTGGGNFSPKNTLTRGQLLVMVMKAYGIEPTSGVSGNFKDAGNAYYTDYLAAAKKLGIDEGVKNNKFAPNKKMTRQEMFSFLYDILKQIDKLPSATTDQTLTDYSDADQIAKRAKEPMTLFVKTGIVGESGNKLNPKGSANRALIAQVLYDLLTK